MSAILRLVIILCLSLAAALPATAAGKGGAEANPVSEAPLVIFNRTVAVFRSDFFGITPLARVARAKAAIEGALSGGGELKVVIKENPEGRLVLMGDTLAFVITAGDVDPLAPVTPVELAAQAARNLEQVITETHEARNLSSMLTGAVWAAAATAIFVLLLWGLSRVRSRVSQILTGVTERKMAALKIGGMQVVEGQHLIPLLRRTLALINWLLIAIFSYEWLSFVLSSFPYTRPWGERLNNYFVGIVFEIGGGIIAAIPGIGVAIAIFMLARVTVKFLGRFLERLSHSGSAPVWLGLDTLATTRQLFNVGIWLFAVAMAYPYLPGAGTDAFKGLSVLLGLMVSLGASSVVGQAASGLILTYTRTILVGEYVRVGEHEGTVTRLGSFTTTIRTGLGEELTIPNSLITGSVTKNYSRAVHGKGYIVDTTVTIGYDTPWRQVDAMLIEAANRTPGILKTPAPRVFQTALSDFYPEYRLVAQAIPSEPRPRAEVLTVLHANIQDVFNEYDVQIMSPHYLGDPKQAKVVKAEDWHLAPAKKA